MANSLTVNVRFFLMSVSFQVLLTVMYLIVYSQPKYKILIEKNCKRFNYFACFLKLLKPYHNPYQIELDLDLALK